MEHSTPLDNEPSSLYPEAVRFTWHTPLRSSRYEAGPFCPLGIPMKYVALVVFTIAAVFGHSGAFSSEQTDRADVPASGSSGSARLRLFGQNGIGVTLYKNSACTGGAESIRVSGGFGSALSSLFGSVTNESIGIPETITSSSLAQRDGALSKAYFREYAVESGKPLTVTMGFQDPALRKYCKTIAATFIPAPDSDYEGRLDVDLNKGQCVFSIGQVLADGSLMPVKVGLAETCS